MFNVKLESGLFEKTRLLSNFLLVILLAGNLFFSSQYIVNIKEQIIPAEDVKATLRLQLSRFLKTFIDTVLSTEGTITYDDRVKLENDIRQTKDADLIRLWDEFIASKTGEEAQARAIKLMSMVTNKML